MNEMLNEKWKDLYNRSDISLIEVILCQDQRGSNIQMKLKEE